MGELGAVLLFQPVYLSLLGGAGDAGDQAALPPPSSDSADHRGEAGERVGLPAHSAMI
jgi:hypothetical protein